MGFVPAPLRVGLLLALSGCASIEAPLIDGEPGTPLPGLTEDQLLRFREGRALFGRAFTPEEGLGPIFNQARCVSCHDLPESGGHGAEPVTKISHYDPDTGCDPLTRLGGSLLQSVIVLAMREAGLQPERIPREATGVTMITPPPLFGLGLVEALSEEAILSRSDPEDVDGDGISGRPGLDADGQLARFGLRATHATLDSFIEEAIRVEMGLTTPKHPDEMLPNGEPLPPGMDPAPDPEVGDTEIELLSDYVRFLAPTEPTTPDPVGEEIFRDLGCAECHTPTMTTAPNDNPALNRKRFRIYSDFLLHDMGRELADICTPGSVPGEWRTMPLVGLRFRDAFLHRGLGFPDLTMAIEAHGGEASAAREAFNRLSPARKHRLVVFLKSL